MESRNSNNRSLAASATRSALVVALAYALAGCAYFKSERQTRTRRGASAMLVAARARSINMFGDFQASPPAAYKSRTATSLRQHSFTEIGSDYDVDIDRTGRNMIFASTRHNVQPDLYVKSIDGVAVTQLTSDPAADIQPVFSPDDTRVAFASDRAGNWDIWVMSVAGGPPVQVTRGLGDEVHPSWSPDGTKLVYCSLPADGGQWELWIADALSGGTSRFVGYGLFPEWSPTGDVILYQRARERGSRLFGVWTLTLVAGEPRYPTEIASAATHAYTLPTWSADGTRIAFAGVQVIPDEISEPVRGDTMPAPGFDIWQMDADGRGKTRLTDGHTMNYAPAFGPDGRLYFTCSRSGYENVWSLLPGGGVGGTSGRDIASGKAYDGTTTATPPNLDTFRTGAASLAKDGF